MGVNRFYTFGDTATNILSNSQYQTDSERTAGNPPSSIARSNLMNKVLRQCACVAYAIGQLVASGSDYDADDSSPSNIISGLSISMKKVFVATFSVSSNVWNLTIPDLLSQYSQYAVIVPVTATSIDNQAIKINGGSNISVYINNTTQLKAGDIVGTTTNPFPVLIIISGGKAYIKKDVTAAQITSWTNHVASRSNPHEVTYTQVGAAPTSHNHSASNITSGTLPVARGGTGQTTIAGIKTSLGAGAASGLATLDANVKVLPAQASAMLISANASKTLALSDAGCTLYNSTANVTITIPTNDTVAFPTGTEIEFIRYGAGTVTFAPASGVSLYSIDNARTISATYGVVCLKKMNANSWILAGALG